MDQQGQVQKTLLDELGLENLPQEKKDQLLIKMTEALLKRIFIETMEKLDEKGRGEYDKLVEEKADPQKMEEFLASRIGGYEEMVKKVIEEFKEEMKKNLLTK